MAQRTDTQRCNVGTALPGLSRPAGSKALADTRRYLTTELKALGLTVQEQAFQGDTPNGPVPMINKIAASVEEAVGGIGDGSTVMLSGFGGAGMPVRLVDGQAQPAFKSSGDITSLANADGYIEIPADIERIEAGTMVEVTLF